MSEFYTFGLSKCKKLSVRRRTLCGTTTYYYTYFEPKHLDRHSRKYAIDSFKHPKTKSDRLISNQMIEYSINEFLKQHNIDEFDYIMGIPSASGVVNNIINQLISRCGYRGRCYTGFRKTRIRNIKLKQYVIDRELSLKTKEKVPKAFNHIRKLHYDRVSKSSLFPTRFRRYFENFLKLDFFDHSRLINKKILLVDDTFGEGLTLCECVKLLEPYTKNVLGFTVMKDMAVKR